MRTVLLTTCANNFEAELLKGLLERAGIPSMIEDSMQVALWSGVGPDTTGGVRLCVFEDQLENARKVIKHKPEPESDEALEKASQEAFPLEKLEEDED